RDGHVTGVQTCALPIWRMVTCSQLPLWTIPFCILNQGGRSKILQIGGRRRWSLFGPAWHRLRCMMCHLQMCRELGCQVKCMGLSFSTRRITSCVHALFGLISAVRLSVVG